MSPRKGLRPTFLEELEDQNQPATSDRFAEFGEVRRPQDAEAPILGQAVRQTLHQWLYELNYVADLDAVGVKPRRRVMLSGPPGTGKTTLAHHVAGRLGVDLVIVETPALVSQYVGETSRNVGRLFGLARRSKGAVALFFDEFDSVAAKRTDGGSSAAQEKNTIVSSLLQMFDRYDGLLFAATNRSDAIDPAIWRRFQLQITVGLPDQTARFSIAKRYFAPFKASEPTISAFASGMEGAAPALIKEVVEGVKRDLTLAPKLNQNADARSVFARVMSSITPADDMPLPPLWDAEKGDAALAAIIAAGWPPSRETA